jgi:hypothetical protein
MNIIYVHALFCLFTEMKKNPNLKCKYVFQDWLFKDFIDYGRYIY